MYRTLRYISTYVLRDLERVYDSDDLDIPSSTFTNLQKLSQGSIERYCESLLSRFETDFMSRQAVNAKLTSECKVNLRRT